jgi:colicin import membrane protein
MGKAMWALVANPLGAVLTAIAVVIGVLFLAFKSFQPVVDKVEQAFAALGAVVNVIKNSFIAVVMGTKSLGEAFGDLSGDMDEAATRTMALVKAQQDLEDVMKSQEVTTARNRAEINKLNVELKNRTLTEEQRLKIANKIIQKEEADYKQRKAIVDQEVRLAREAIAIKAKFTAEEIILLKKTGDATKELAESRGGNYDEEYEALNKARIKAIDLENDVVVATEKAYNRRDKLEDDRIAKEEKRAAEAKAAREKAAAERLKAEEKAAAERKAYLDKANATEDEFAAIKKEKEKAEADRKKQEYEEGLATQLERAANEKAIADQKAREDKIREDEAKQFLIDKDNAIAASQQNLNNIIANLEAAGITRSKAGQAILKGVALTQIGIDSAVALSKATTLANAEGVAAQAAFPLVPGIGTVARVVSYASTAASVIGNIARAKKLLSGGGGGSTSGGGQTSTPRGSQGASATPQVNFQASSENQIGNTVAGRINAQPPIRVTVLESDITKTQGQVQAKVVSNSF